MYADRGTGNCCDMHEDNDNEDLSEKMPFLLLTKILWRFYAPNTTMVERYGGRLRIWILDGLINCKKRGKYIIETCKKDEKKKKPEEYKGVEW